MNVYIKEIMYKSLFPRQASFVLFPPYISLRCLWSYLKLPFHFLYQYVDEKRIVFSWTTSHLLSWLMLLCPCCCFCLSANQLGTSYFFLRLTLCEWRYKEDVTRFQKWALFLKRNEDKVGQREMKLFFHLYFPQKCKFVQVLKISTSLSTYKYASVYIRGFFSG